LITVALICLGLVALGALVALVLASLKFSRTSKDVADVFVSAHATTLGSLERIHQSNMQQLSTMADRFMAMDFAQFKGYQAAEIAEEGGFEMPEEPTRVEVVLPGGRVRTVGAEDEATLAERANERQLLAEDFPEGWDEK